MATKNKSTAAAAPQTSTQQTETTAGQQTKPEGNEPAPELRVVINAPKGLNLREGPAKTFAVIDELPEGRELTVLPVPAHAIVPGWIVVETDGLVGWVSGEYTAPVSSGSEV